jgi:sugar phosphate isomerase/epimerase
MIREPNVCDVMRYIVGFVVAVVHNDDVPYELRIQGLEELRNLARLLPDEVDILRRAGNDHVGVCFDTANSIGCLESAERVLETLECHVVNVHVKDYRVFRPPHNKGFLAEGLHVENYPDRRQVAVETLPVEAIPDQVFVGHLETPVFDGNVSYPASCLVE